MKPIKVGLIGWGTVGAGAAKILLEEAECIEKKLGGKLVLSKIADLDIETPRPGNISSQILTTDVEDIFQDPEIEIVAELIGGMEPARTFILRALSAGKHVVTANKALLAVHGKEIMEAAKAAGRDILFEASVGGGIPVIRSLKEGLAADRVQRVFGILNGTSNYILTKMTLEGMDFTQALKEAQEQGYAEADPTYDVEGIDAAHKLVILVSLAYGFRVNLDEIFVEGISKLDPLDIQFADEFGYVIKLLAISSRVGNQIEARLHPAMLPKRHLLSDVKGPFNAIYINGEAVGDILLYGAGAGMMPTGTAVVGDIIELARAIQGKVNQRVPPMAWNEEINGNLSLKPMDDVITPYYFRFSALDQPGVLSKISGLLGVHGISISSVIQKGREIDGAVPIVMLTHEAREADVRSALNEIDRLDVLRGETVLIRLEERL